MLPPPITQLTAGPGKVTTAADRLVCAFNNPESLFTLDQVVYLMATAQRWGYEARQAEENTEYLAPRHPVQVVGKWIDQVDYRRTCDAAATLPRINDYTGGPVTWTPEEKAA